MDLVGHYAIFQAFSSFLARGQKADRIDNVAPVIQHFQTSTPDSVELRDCVELIGHPGNLPLKGQAEDTLA